MEKRYLRKRNWRNISRELLQTLCVPLVIGSPTNSRQNTTDGRVSSTVVAACLLPVLFVLTLISSLTDNYKSSLLTPRWMILIFLNICSVASTIGLSVAIYRNRSQWLKPNTLVDMSQKPKLLFLWFFGISIALNSALNISANIDCMVIGGYEQFPGQMVVSIVVHLIAISFYCGQLGFLSYFVNYRIISCVILNYCISCMLITHVVGWLNVTISTFFKNDILRPSHNYTNFNETDCYWSTDINKFRKRISAFIDPAHTEYSLLSVAFILRLWATSGETESPLTSLFPTEDREEADEESPLLSSYRRRSKHTKRQNAGTAHSKESGYPVRVDGAYEDDSQHSINNYVVGLPRTPADGHEDASKTAINEDETSFSRPEHNVLAPRPPGRLYVTILLGVLFSMPYLVGVVYAINVNQSNITTASVLQIARTIFAIIYFISVVMTYRLLHRHYQIRQERRVFSGKDYIMVLCTSGAVAFKTFVFLAGIKVPNTFYGSLCALTAADAVIDSLTIYLQTVLIFCSDHCRKKTTHTSSRIEYYFVFLCILNFVLWFGDSYMSSHHVRTARVPHEMYGTMYWSVIVEVLFPFTIFYRFHSSMDMYERYRQFIQD